MSRSRESFWKTKISNHRMHRFHLVFPDFESKTDLLSRGIKNRSLLRELLTVPEDQHARLIAEAAGREEILLDPSQTEAKPADLSAEKTEKPLQSQSQSKTFAFH